MKIRNQRIGIDIQEKIAIEIENILDELYPSKYITHSNGTRYADVPIIENETKKCIAKCEVKSAKEYIPHIWRDKTTREIIKKTIRRGMFNIKPEQLRNDIYVFVIRFVEIDRENFKTHWNGDFETFYAFNDDVKIYLEQQPLNCVNWKLCIDKLPELNVTQNFLDVFEEILQNDDKNEFRISKKTK